jgi:hypothetical protein
MKLRFSIRDLLWLTLVVGLCVAWLFDHQRQAENYDKSHNSWLDFGTKQLNETAKAKHELRKLTERYELLNKNQK